MSGSSARQLAQRRRRYRRFVTLEYCLLAAAALFASPFITSNIINAAADNEPPDNGTANSTHTNSVTSTQILPDKASAPDDSWSPSRIEKYNSWIKGKQGDRIGILEITGTEAFIPVFANTSEYSLTLGAGHIDDTSELTGSGNIGIAGHRDGYFRILRRVALGDTLRLHTLKGARSFKVDDLRVVDPADVWVLEPTPFTKLTLITCHPFYYVGPAPSRFIVSATLKK